ncbi:mitotic spindle assembly checkpoint protein MAD1 isoform X1 [Panthera tigris]|uniref:mitotic spindle assembly checkpoint protein MAD1 isoform X1 n=1 Tax=Panthera tigris TaxID=9694 RepID=UPI001C6F9117|nr:mitotic spindle assembly checkpoint protein MAD1 isoform X1 [Panthera tigris]
MDDLGENTTVLSTLRSLNNFISQRVEAGSGLDAPTSAQGSLQMQYQESMQLEERAERIRSQSQVVQVEWEKTQMELSHKRARVELERAASTSARRYEREVDRNQELLTRIRQLQEREAEAEERMKEQLERHRRCRQSLDAAGQKLREKEDGLAAAGETISTLKGKVSELQWSVMNQEMQVKSLESEKQELQEQLALQRKKCQEANEKVQELQARQEARADQEQRIRDLEQKLSLQEQDAAVVKNMKSELVRLPKMERELKQLREESACLREMRETNGLLREELEGLRRRLGRQEKMQESLAVLELEKEKLLAKLQSWERLEQTTGLNIRTPEDLSRFIVDLQQRELALQDRNNVITSSARGLEKVRQQLQEEVRQASGQLLEERKRRETQEALARRLQKRVLLLTKERDGMRAILGSYDSELTPAEYSPQLTRRMREAEDMVQKVHAHSSEMEAQLSQALEELGGQKQRADMLEVEVKMLQCQTSASERGFPVSREEVSSLRLKIEELEGERSRLEEEKKTLEAQLERLTLQGGYDQSKTKVLHMSMNPASAAKQRLREDQARLQEECERLRELVRALERGGPVPADLEAAAGLPSSKEVAELKKQVESAELRNQRLKEVFHTKIQEFRKVCYALTGYQIDVTTESQYRLTSMYAEHKADCLIFKATGPSGAKMQLLETAFSRTVPELIELHLLRQDSIPAFLSALTLDLFSRQTVA